MLLLVLLCVLVAFAMLVLAVATSAAVWAWGSVIASVLAAGLLVTDYVVRRRRDRQAASPTGSPANADAATGGHGSATATSGHPGTGADAATAVVTPAASTTREPTDAPAHRPAGPPSRSDASDATHRTPPPAWPGAPSSPGAGAAAAPSGPYQGPGHQGPGHGAMPRGRPGVPPLVLPWASASGRLGRDPSRVPGAPAGSRFLGVVALPGSPAAARQGTPPVPSAGPPPGRSTGPGHGWAPHRSAPPPQIDPATTRLDPARLAEAAASGATTAAAGSAPEHDATRDTVASGPDATREPETLSGMTAGSPPPQSPAQTPPPTTPPPTTPPPTTPPPASSTPAAAAGPQDEPVDAAQTAVVAGLDTEVLVIDEEPHLHLQRCSYLAGRDVIPITAAEAIELGFSGCSWCTPVATLAATQGADSHR